VRTAAVKILEKLCAGNANIFLLSADLGFKLFDRFKNTFPDRFINVGVAEANMIGVAAGLALSGKNVYCYSMVPFLTMRCFEQIRVDLCYHNLNVKLLGVGGGLHYGLEGMTHHAIEDIAIMRSLPNMTVVVPGDPLEVQAVIDESVAYEGPLYIRLAKDERLHIYDTMPTIKIGKGSVIHEGGDISILANGSMLYPAKLVTDKLAGKGLGVTLVSMHTVKPLDLELIKRCATHSKALFTVEEHSIIGGLGSAVGEALMDLNYKGLFRRIGMPDVYGRDIGHDKYLLERCGLTPAAIADYVLREYEHGQC
jgi:transketolase